MGGTVYEGQELGAKSLRLSGSLTLSTAPPPTLATASHSLTLPWHLSLQGTWRGHSVHHHPF